MHPKGKSRNSIIHSISDSAKSAKKLLFKVLVLAFHLKDEDRKPVLTSIWLWLGLSNQTTVTWLYKLVIVNS